LLAACVNHGVTNDSLLHALRRVPALAELSADQLGRLAAAMSTRRYRQGDVVFAPEAPSEELYVVLEGHLRVFQDASGAGHQTLGVIGPGDSVAEMSVFDEDPHRVGADANTDCTVAVLPRGRLTAIAAERPDILLEMARHLSRRLDLVENRTPPGSMVVFGRPAEGKASNGRPRA
jgi:CRP-like cAMP-binding protein